MQRQAELDLLRWYQSKNRKPLMLRGARQIGKSTLVRNFAKANNLDLVELNFEKTHLHSPQQSLDLKIILPEIEYVTKRKISPRSLIFLDEIQDNPKMITALRFFKEDRPDLAVIAAESLLEFALTEHKVSMPVGRLQYYHLGPFTFSEFVQATGNRQLFETIDLDNINYDIFKINEIKIPEFADRALKELYMKYLFIGGMPGHSLKPSSTSRQKT